MSRLFLRRSNLTVVFTGLGWAVVDEDDRERVHFQSLDLGAALRWKRDHS